MAYNVVVTGATGFVATELVKQLLCKGYNVRATVRNIDDPATVPLLNKLSDCLPGTLTFYQADLLVPGSFDEAVNGADFVFHVASPFRIDVANPQTELVEPAVHGTRNVLASVAKYKDTVKRVVVTSSVAAVHGGGSKVPPINGKLYTEEDHNKSSTIENGEGYWVSKTQAEQAAWDAAKESGIDLVTILPNFVLGPLTLPRVDGLSAGFVKNWVEGQGSTGDLTICDVRDVAQAHIAAVEVPAAPGRYIVSHSHSISSRFVAETLKARFPDYIIAQGENVPTSEVINNNKAKRELGLYPRPPQETLVDMAVTLVQLGLATPQLKPC